jgi:hypothetical protein
MRRRGELERPQLTKLQALIVLNSERRGTFVAGAVLPGLGRAVTGEDLAEAHRMFPPRDDWDEDDPEDAA